VSSASKPTEAALAKALLFLDRLKNRVRQLDSELFPTDASRDVKKLLLTTFDRLAERSNDPRLDPIAFLNVALRLHDFVALLERSSNSLIPWPVVRFCDRIWGELFQSSNLRVFFSTHPYHNYGIMPYSRNLRQALKPVARIGPLWQPDGDILCLLLASLEEDNLPSYANIAHEFGHVAFELHQKHAYRIWKDISRSLADKLSMQNSRILPPDDINSRMTKLHEVLWSITEELVADCVASMLLGHSFFLSLTEMSLKAYANVWSAVLSPAVSAYPSYRFRLETVKERLGFDTFLSAVQAQLNVLISEDESNIVRIAYPEPLTLGQDRFDVVPKEHQFEPALQELLHNNLVELTACLRLFADQMWDHLKQVVPNHMSDIDPNKIAELVLRLEMDTPPNIIPNGTLLGEPASFLNILTASSLYRLSLLTAPSPRIRDDATATVRKVERLANKAIEVSYVQREYNEWSISL
jgi:hypothetical protein